MKILFIFAHPDDEAFGPAGTIAKLAREGNQIWIVSMCQGNRPGAEDVASSRQTAFASSCTALGAYPVLLKSNDVYLDYHVAVNEITRIVNGVKPDTVYTHSMADIHRDHRITAEACMVACRPKPDCSVQALYTCEIPASSDWAFDQFGKFRPQVYVDITEYIEIKRKIIELYSTEVYEYPDARSIMSMEVMAQNRGRQVGYDYAEAFQLVYSRDNNK
jgi:LmbE family N-acetylglucosaminyl deacetylase